MKNYHEIRARLERIKSDLEALADDDIDYQLIHRGGSLYTASRVICVQSSFKKSAWQNDIVQAYDPETKTNDPTDRLRAELELDREALEKHFHDVELVSERRPNGGQYFTLRGEVPSGERGVYKKDERHLTSGKSQYAADGESPTPEASCDTYKSQVGDLIYSGPDGVLLHNVGDRDPEPSNSNSYDNVMSRVKRVRDALIEARQCPGTSYIIESTAGGVIQLNEYQADGRLSQHVYCWRTYDEPKPAPPKGRLVICVVLPWEGWMLAFSSGETGPVAGRLKIIDKLGRTSLLDHFAKHWYDLVTEDTSDGVEISEIPKDLLELAKANAALRT